MTNPGVSAIEPAWTLALAEEAGLRAAAAPQHRHPALLRAAAESPRCVVRITGPVDRDRLRHAVSAVVQAHPALRQRLLAAPSGPCVVTAAAVQTAPAPGPGIATLMPEPDGSHLLTVTPSPGSVDETGLLRALTAIAAAYCGVPVPAENVPPEEVDQFFSGLLTDPAAQRQRQHWRLYGLEYTAPQLALTLMPRPQAALPRRVPVRLKPETRTVLNATAARLDVGLDAILLAAWRALLLRVAPGEQGSLAVFIPGPIGQLPQFVGLLGRRVPLPVRSPHPSTSVDDAIRACQTELAGIREFGDFFAAAPDDGWTAGFHSIDVPDLTLGPGARATVVDLRADTEPVGLDLRVRQQDGQVHLELVDTAGAPDIGRAGRLMWILEQLLDRLTQMGNETLAAALTGQGGVRLQGERRRTGSTLLAAVAAQAVRTPRAVAARDDRTQLSYRELLAATEQLSRTLSRLGVAAGDRVAVCMSRRVTLLIAMLAAAHRGAAFVPVDPSFPAGRIADLLDDAGPAAVLTDAAGSRSIPGGLATHLVDEPPVSPTTDASDPAGVSGPDDPVYVIYTSGSTGRPKGVQITHAALMNYLSWAADRYDAAGGSGTLVHSSIAVDMTVTSLFLPLLVGRTVTFLPSDEPADLADALRGSRDLSPLKVTPGGLRLLISLLTSSEIRRAARHLVVGGEQLTNATLTGLDATGLTVTNEYGPTETTVGCCAHTFRLGEPVSDPVPIGLPIWNTTVAIQVSEGIDALPWTAGELVVSGPSVATGYLHPRPDVVRRFGTAADGTRSYRTGDLVVHRPDGRLQMLGRIDGQLKIRGYRVEPGEVEAALAMHPDVAAVAVAATPGSSDKILTAFLVGREGGSDDIAEQAAALAADRLPFYARPDQLVVLDRLPLSPNGKIDRSALERWQPAAEAPAMIGTDDLTLTTIAQLWQEVLGAPPSGPNANFFSSGADSIKAVLLAARAQRAGLRLTVHHILERRTLKGISAAVQSLSAPGAAAASGPAALSPHQRGALHRSGEPWRGWTLRWIAEIPDHIKAADIEATLLSTMWDHPALRTTLSHDGTQWTAQVIEPKPQRVEVADLAGLPDEEKRRVLNTVLQRCENCIDLGTSLLQTALITDDQHPRRQVAVVAHHLACDVVSLQHIVDRLRRAGHPEPPVADDGYLTWLRATGSLPETPFPGPSPAASAPLPHRSRLDAGTGRALLTAYQGRDAAAAFAAIVLRALADVRPDLPTAVCVELHGRDRAGADLAAAVGWLTDFRPLNPRPAELADLPALTAAIRAQLAAPVDPAASALPPVAVNYLGELSSGLPALQRHTDPPALFPLEVVAWAQPDGLVIFWRYDSGFMPRPSVERLAQAFGHHARVLAAAGTVHPADADGIDAADLTRIAATFEG